jgi:transcription termination/antitermination protein NusA
MATKQVNNEINLFEAIQQFCSDKGLSKDSVLTIIKDSLVGAYKKKLGLEVSSEADVNVEFSEKNEVVIVVPKKVVETNSDSPFEITLAKAKAIDPNAEIGGTVQFKEKPIELSRIVSNQARQMVFQKLKEMERELLYNEYKIKEGELTHGYLQSRTSQR